MAAEPGENQAEVLGLLDAAPDGVLVVDAEGIVVWANRAAHEVFSPRGGALTGRSLGRPVVTGVPQRIEVIDSWGSSGPRRWSPARSRWGTVRCTSSACAT